MRVDPPKLRTESGASISFHLPPAILWGDGSIRVPVRFTHKAGSRTQWGLALLNGTRDALNLDVLMAHPERDYCLEIIKHKEWPSYAMRSNVRIRIVEYEIPKSGGISG